LSKVGLGMFLLAAAACSSTVLATGGEDWRAKVGPDAAPRQIAPIRAPFDMPQLSRPVFPDRVFNVADHGAVGDGRTKNTQAIATAIDACAKAGGGVVLLPKGTWLTGAIHLKSNVNLHLGQGATLRFSDDPTDYLPVVFTRWAGFECYNYSPLIYACDCENIAVTGPGTIDGNGRPWWPWEKRQADTAMRMYKEQILKDVPVAERVYGRPEHGLRPQLISPIRCKNVLLEGFTIAKAGPFWTIDLVYCDRVIARRLRVLTTGGPNTDGLNVDSSTNVLIEHCYFNTGDDCICMKSGMNEDGWRVGKATENVVVRYNLTEKGHGGVVFGSDTSGGIRNVFFHSCIFRGTDVGIRLKSTRGRGGVVERLWGRNIDMARVRREAIQMTTAYRAWMGTTKGKAPTFRNMTFRDLKVSGAGQAVKLQGLPEAPIQSLRLADITMTTREGFSAEWTKDVRLEKVTIRASKPPALRWKHCDSLTIDGQPQGVSGNILTARRGTAPDHEKGLPHKLAHESWPPQITAEVGDLGIRFESRSFWTLYRIDYKGTRICLDRFGSHYGSVVSFPGVGFIGSGHTENEDEQVLGLKLLVDGNPVARPEATVRCRRLRLHKTSRIRSLVLETDICVQDNRIFEDVQLKADKPTPVNLIYHFMHPWTPTATDYIAELLDGKRVDGAFNGDRKHKIDRPTRWSAIYDRPSGRGAVTYVLDAPRDDDWRTRYWDVPNRYRKHYFTTFLGKTVPANKAFRYRVVTVPFEASDTQWERETARVAETCEPGRATSRPGGG